MNLKAFRAEERFDVVVLGSGFGGALLAAILARQGRRVLLLEKSIPPRNLYMVEAAIRHGAVYREKTDVCGLVIDAAGVRLTTHEGDEHAARFLIDATGRGSLLARLQSSSTRCAGDRWFLLTDAAGVDALYSRGLVSLFETLRFLVGPLLEALATDDFRRECFAGAERLQQAVLDAGDLLDAGEALVSAVAEGMISAGEAGERILELLQLAPPPPVQDAKRPSAAEWPLSFQYVETVRQATGIS